MAFKITTHSITTAVFYLILIYVSHCSLKHLTDEPTAFEESVVLRKAKLPSFTLCPSQPGSSKPIQDFEDVTKAIEIAKNKYTIEVLASKAYEFSKVLNESSSNTLQNIWYFAPKTSIDLPFETVICLIWTPFKENIPDPDHSIWV